MGLITCGSLEKLSHGKVLDKGFGHNGLDKGLGRTWPGGPFMWTANSSTPPEKTLLKY